MRTPMLSRIIFFAAIPATYAQQNATYLTGLLQTLHGLGVNTFANSAQQINSTSTGQNLLNVLSDGRTPLTLFAPDDGAFAGLLPNISSNPQLFADVVSYHVLSGNFSDKTATYPNVTVGRTYLDDLNVVALEANKPQVLVWSRLNDSRVHILNQNTLVTVTNTTTYGSIFINVVDAVLDVPMYFSTSLGQAGLTGLKSVLSAIPYTYYNSSGAAVNTTYFSAFDAGGADGVRGYTFFAPNDAALSAAASSLAGLADNATAMLSVVQNHIINGTSVYSPSLVEGSPSYTSSAGETLSFLTNSSGTFVQSGNSQARIVQTDVLVNNGVLHVIDGVLLNEASDSSSASSAYASATSAAAHSSTETGPIDSPTSTTSSSKSTRVTFGFGAGHALALMGAFVGVLLV